MLCYVGTLRKFQLGHDGIRARVFFLAFFLQEFDLLPTLQNFRKRALEVPLGNLTQLGSTGTFRGAVCSKMLYQVGTSRKFQLGHDGLRARGFFSAFFLQEFDLLPTLQNFRKRALGVPLANLTQLGSTGTFRGVVCSKMLCQVGTLRKSQLGHNGIRARVFFLAFFLQQFDVLPTLQNFRKRALWDPLANLTQLSSTGTFRGAVCSKMLCQVGTSRKFQLGHDGIRARVFFLAFFLQEFDLLPTVQNFRKRALGVPLANLTQLGSTGTFRGALCSKMLCQDGTSRKSQLRHDGIRARVFFLAFFLQEFDLLPTVQNFRKRALWDPLANLTQLSSTGTFRGAVCSKMLCQVGTSRKFQLGHDGIRARVFFLAFFLQEFDLLPTVQNFRKRALGVLLANLTQLGSTGTFRGALCSEMLCEVGT